jgi:hypothetical protein
VIKEYITVIAYDLSISHYDPVDGGLLFDYYDGKGVPTIKTEDGNTLKAYQESFFVYRLNGDSMKRWFVEASVFHETYELANGDPSEGYAVYTKR